MGGSGWSWGGRRLLVGVEQGRRPMADGGGAAPAVRGGGELVWKLRGGERKLVGGSIGGEDGWMMGFTGEAWGGDGAGLLQRASVAGADRGGGR